MNKGIEPVLKISRQGPALLESIVGCLKFLREALTAIMKEGGYASFISNPRTSVDRKNSKGATVRPSCPVALCSVKENGTLVRTSR
jgi:hypothetical protein